MDDHHGGGVEDLAEYDVLAVEPIALSAGDEELRTVGVWTRVGHGEQPRSGVAQVEVLVGEGLAVDRDAPRAVALEEVAFCRKASRLGAAERATTRSKVRKPDTQWGLGRSGKQPLSRPLALLAREKERERERERGSVVDAARMTALDHEFFDHSVEGRLDEASGLRAAHELASAHLPKVLRRLGRLVREQLHLDPPRAARFLKKSRSDPPQHLTRGTLEKKEKESARRNALSESASNRG